MLNIPKIPKIPKEFITKLADTSYLFQVPREKANTTYELMPLTLPDGTAPLSLIWAADSIDLIDCRQPALYQMHDIPSYINFTGHSVGYDQYYSQDFFINPYPDHHPYGRYFYECNEPGKFYWFRGYEDSYFVGPIQAYNLRSNNSHLTIDSLTVFNKDYTQGVLVKIEASAQGYLGDILGNDLWGQIVIKVSIDDIRS